MKAMPRRESPACLCWAACEVERLGIHQASSRLWNLSPQFFSGFDPLFDNDLGVSHSFHVGFPVRHTARQFRHFDDVGIILRAPVNHHFVFILLTHPLRLRAYALELCHEPASPDMLSPLSLRVED